MDNRGCVKLDAHVEAARQIAAADVVLVTKTDLVPDTTVEELRQQIAVLSPGVSVRSVLHGEIDPDVLFQLASESDLAIPDAASDMAQMDREPGRSHDHHDHSGHDTNEVHAHGAIRSLAISTDQRINWPRLRDFLEIVFSLRGERFLRVKGIIWPDDGDRPVLLQGVGNAFSPPRPLAREPDEPGRSRIVFIYEGLDGSAIEKTFRAMVLDRSDRRSDGTG